MNDFPLRPHVQTFLTNVVDFLSRLRMIMTYTSQHGNDVATSLVVAAAGVEAEMLISSLGPVEGLNDSELSTVELPVQNLKRMSAARLRILQKICSSAVSPYSGEPKDDNKKLEEQLGHLGEEIGQAMDAVRDAFSPDFAEAGREIGEAVGAAADIIDSYWGNEDRGDSNKGDDDGDK